MSEETGLKRINKEDCYNEGIYLLRTVEPPKLNPYFPFVLAWYDWDGKEFIEDKGEYSPIDDSNIDSIWEILDGTTD